MLSCNKFQLITIDYQYLSKLYSACNQVFYKPQNYNKPYLGVLINRGGREYAIPLTSAKNKHKSFKNYQDGQLLIYENLPWNSTIDQNKNICIVEQSGIKHILAVLVIKKMIPIKKGHYSICNFQINQNDSPTEKKYKNLLNKEFKFCVSGKARIINKANTIYNRQVNTKKIFCGYVDFKLLEQECDNYK